MVNIQFQILVVVLTATLTDSATVFVSSRNGKDKNGCGRDLTFPCKSLGYVLETKVTVINLDGGKDELNPLTYEVYKTFQLKRDIAMEGTGKVLPIILMPNQQGSFNRYLFHSSDNHTITVNRIRFYNASLITIGISYSNIKLHNCVLERCNDFIAREIILARKDLLNFEITNCKFINSKFNLLFADLRIFNSTIVRSSIHATDVVVVNISNCVFQNIHNAFFTCKLPSYSVVTISNTSFMNTLPFKNAITVSLCSELYILYSSFEGFKYNTIRMDYVGQAIVKRSIFKNNKGMLGGALTLTRSQVVVVINSMFLNNTAMYGGAIYLKDGTVGLLVENSKFISNTALVLGGSIYAIIRKSTFYATITLHNVTMYGNPIYPLSSGVLIYSTIRVIFRNVTMAVSNMLPEWPITDGFTCHVSCLSSLDFWTVNFTYICPDNHYVVPVKYGKLKELSSLRCVRCKKNSYTVRHGKFQILHDRSRVLNKYATCLKCPSGGQCDNGITSRDNFWGYATVQRIVAFLPCPPSYCCSRGKVKCVSYNTCNRHRMGILCGSCKTGYRVNFFDESCILKTGCRKHSFWLLYFFYAIIYTGILLYYKNVFLFILKHIRSFKKTKVLHKSVMEPLLDGTEFDISDREDERNTAIISAVATQEDPCTTPNYHEEVSMIKNISGTKTILFFFYQIEVLLRINENNHQTKSVVGNVKKIISSVFNLQIISEPLSKLCPSEDLTKVGKEVVKISIIPTAMMFLILAFVTKKIYSACISRRREEGELAKVKSCLIQLTLLGYTGISAFCLRMMNCVNINGTHHLYIQGDVVCFLWWQYLIMVFFFIWIVLFPLSTYLSEKMLTKDYITSSQFYFCFAFPPYVIYRYLTRKRIIPDFNSNQPYDGTKEKDQIIGLFQGPYRSKISNSGTINWEIIVLLRRLILSAMCTCVVNPVWKTFFTFPMLLLFLLHHWYEQSFCSNALNKLETASLSLLLTLNVFNLIWAMDYMYAFTELPGFKLIDTICVWTRDIILVSPPLVIVVILVSAAVKKLYCMIRNYFHEKEN